MRSNTTETAVLLAKTISANTGQIPPAGLTPPHPRPKASQLQLARVINCINGTVWLTVHSLRLAEVVKYPAHCLKLARKAAFDNTAIWGRKTTLTLLLIPAVHQTLSWPVSVGFEVLWSPIVSARDIARKWFQAGDTTWWTDDGSSY